MIAQLQQGKSSQLEKQQQKQFQNRLDMSMEITQPTSPVKPRNPNKAVQVYEDAHEYVLNLNETQQPEPIVTSMSPVAYSNTWPDLIPEHDSTAWKDRWPNHVLKGIKNVFFLLAT